MRYRRNIFFARPDTENILVQTETGEQLVCYPFWQVFKTTDAPGPRRELVLRRGAISVPLQNFTTKEEALKVSCAQKAGIKTLTLIIPYLVNTTEVMKGDAVFGAAL